MMKRVPARLSGWLSLSGRYFDMQPRQVQFAPVINREEHGLPAIIVLQSHLADMFDIAFYFAKEQAAGCIVIPVHHRR